MFSSREKSEVRKDDTQEQLFYCLLNATYLAERANLEDTKNTLLKLLLPFKDHVLALQSEPIKSTLETNKRKIDIIIPNEEGRMQIEEDTSNISDRHMRREDDRFNLGSNNSQTEDEVFLKPFKPVSAPQTKLFGQRKNSIWKARTVSSANMEKSQTSLRHHDSN